ncbi:MAG: hypothetical protein KIH63_002065 [Candidatus Saccharibacteria bacterium]|nr:hypothetical protein [Candidatus Saccharibacteria bacterium]
MNKSYGSRLLVSGALLLGTASACSPETDPVIALSSRPTPDRPLDAAYDGHTEPQHTGNVAMVDSESSSISPSAEDADIENVPATAENIDEIKPGSVVRNLLAVDAPINIIHVPTNTGYADPASPNYLPSFNTTKFWGDGSEAYRATLLEEIRGTTGGRYNPPEINLTETALFDLGADCVSNEDSAQVELIQEFSQPYADPDSVNVIVIEEIGCGIGGYASTEIMPVLTIDSYEDWAYTMIHEVGHAGGLNHAGTLECDTPETTLGCTWSSYVNDEGSIMGYTYSPSAHDFTFPELMQLGLFEDQEVIIPSTTGDYVIADPLSDDNSAAPKGMIIEGENDERIYFSWENDSEASSDTLCESYHGEPLTDDVLVTGDIDLEFGVDVVCRKVNLRYLDHSLQVRSVDETLRKSTVILRPDRAPDVFDPEDDDLASILYSADMPLGEVNNGSTLYADENHIVTFVGPDGNGNAVVNVQVLDDETAGVRR